MKKANCFLNVRFISTGTNYKTVLFTGLSSTFGRGDITSSFHRELPLIPQIFGNHSRNKNFAENLEK